MKHKIYTIKDVLVGHMTPFCQPNDQFAKRAFANAAQDTKPNNVNVNPEDKELFLVGEFDEETGVITPFEPKFLARASEYVKRGENV